MVFDEIDILVLLRQGGEHLKKFYYVTTLEYHTKIVQILQFLQVNWFKVGVRDNLEMYKVIQGMTIAPITLKYKNSDIFWVSGLSLGTKTLHQNEEYFEKYYLSGAVITTS